MEEWGMAEVGRRQTYTLEALEDSISRRAIETELRGQEFVGKVLNVKSGGFGFIGIEGFDDNVFFHLSSFPGQVPATDWTFQGRVEVQEYRNRPGRFGYVATNGRFEPPRMGAGDSVAQGDGPRTEAPAASTFKQFKLAYERLAQFKPDADYYNIYMDLDRPLDDEPLADSLVWGGIIWCGDTPDYNQLPQITTHFAQDYKGRPEPVEALERVLSCQSCLPFVVVVSIGDRVTEEAQRELYDQCLVSWFKIAVGYLLAGAKRPRQVLTNRGYSPGPIMINVYIEHELQDGHAANESQKERYAGILSELATRNPRYQQLQVVEFGWRGKEFQYIPYGDLLAYWGCGKMQKAFKEWSLPRPADLPGYIVISPRTAALLDDIDRISETANCGSLLDYVGEGANTKLCDSVLRGLGAVFEKDSKLKAALVDALEERYSRKERDLRKLGRQLSAVRMLLGDRYKPERLRTRAAVALVDLKNANHRGRVNEASAAVERLKADISSLWQNDQELAANAELATATHYADCFDIEGAHDVIDNCRSSDRFAALSLLNQAKFHSAAGQYYSMLGLYKEAGGAFDQALRVFQDERLDLDGRSRRGEILQTQTYRAINAIDGGFDNAAGFLADLANLALSPDGETRLSLQEIGARLAESDSIADQYVHHAFVRGMWYLPDLSEARTEYLKSRSMWRSLEQHPWQLICLYRGLMLSELGNDIHADSAKWFMEGITIGEAEGHGPLLALIGAMIRVTADCALGGFGLRPGVLESRLDEIAVSIPKARGRIDELKRVYAAPDPSAVLGVLKLFPFNYH